MGELPGKAPEEGPKAQQGLSGFLSRLFGDKRDILEPRSSFLLLPPKLGGTGKREILNKARLKGRGEGGNRAGMGKKGI